MDNTRTVARRPGLAWIITEGTEKIGSLWVVLATVAVLLWYVKIFTYDQFTGWDFPVFFIPAHLPIHSLYDAGAYAFYFDTRLRPIGALHWAPFVRPAIFSLPLHLYLHLPYFTALRMWTLTDAAAYLFGVFLLIQHYRIPKIVIVFCAAFYPAMRGIISGADIGFIFLLIAASFVLIERRQTKLASLMLSLCLIKFNLLITLPFVLLFQRRFKVLGGWTVGGAVVVVASFALVSPHRYIEAIKNAPAIAGGFFPMGLNGLAMEIGDQKLYTTFVSIAICFSLWLLWRLDLQAGLCAAVVCCALISPYITWYDSTLLVIPLLYCYKKSIYARPIIATILMCVPIWAWTAPSWGQIVYSHVTIEFLLLGWFTFRALSGNRITPLAEREQPVLTI